WVNDLRADDRRPDTPVVATEFVGTSISSGGNGSAEPKRRAALLAGDPGVRVYNGPRGRVGCPVHPGHREDHHTGGENVTRPGARARTAASFVVESGKPGAQPA